MPTIPQHGSPSAERLPVKRPPNGSIQSEERSFAPKKVTPVDLEPIRNPTKASNAVIARGINRFHKCLESHIEQTDTNFEKLEKAIIDLRNELLPGGKKPFAFLSTGQVSFRTVIGMLFGLPTAAYIYRLTVAMWPYINSFLLGK